MRLLRIGQRIINLDLVTSIQDIPTTSRGAAKGRGKGKAGGGGAGGGIRVQFERENTMDFTEEEAEDLLRFLDAHVYLPPPGPVEPVEPAG